MLACAAVVVVPSRTPESFCRTVIEALATGRRVVACKGGGITEVLQELERSCGARASRRLVCVEVPIRACADVLERLGKGG